MSLAIADRAPSPEHFLKSDWDRVLSWPRTRRISALWKARNPLSGNPLEAIWGFCEKTGRLRFFDAPKAREVAGGNLARCRERMGRYASWFPIVSNLRNHKPKITDICELVGAKGGSDDEHLKNAKDHFSTAWYKFSDMTMVAVYDKRIFRQHAALENTFVDGALAQFYDFYAFQNNYWSSIPFDFIADSYSDLPTAYLHMFCDPRLYDPSRPSQDDMFIWPWQRCMRVQVGSTRVSYRAIPTSSLVVDLRNSTTAMNLFRSAENYADFIADVTRVARDVVVKNGGFFDKETGDGIVAHFCNILPTDFRDGCRPVHRAYQASRELGRHISGLCQKYQEYLDMGVWGLAPSVGIHSGQAVWMFADKQIRAIGGSVVTAARLCASAAASQAVISNTAFVELGEILNSSELSSIARKGVSIKEYGDSAQLFGHAYAI